MNNAYFSFPEQDLFVWDMMEEFVLGFNGSKWGNNGPRMVERTYNKYCANSNPEENVDECNGLGIADPPRFFPVPYSKRNQIALPWTSHCQLMKFLADESIGVHWFNKYYKTLGIPKNSVLGTLLQLHCPSVVEAFTPTGLGFVEAVDENTFPEEAKEWMGWEKDDGF
ncbi:Alpha-1,4-N-acetylglucosaminyltransferase [Rhizoclosmatium sp. JEL0117]|nr:Alpha-1,4-N-acetylglucosaminyltransferase [Rhizoclosmatium sp. JEL0117]